MATKRKHSEVTLKIKYEALKELEKRRPNKDVANEFETRLHSTFRMFLF